MQKPKLTDRITSLAQVSWLALKNVKRTSEIIGGILNQTDDPDIKNLIRSHRFLSSVGVGMLHALSGSKKSLHPLEKAGFCTFVIWTNLDKVLDRLPSGDDRFEKTVLYYTELLTQGTTSLTLPFSHPKFTELEVLSGVFYENITTLPNKQEVFDLVYHLKDAVMEQRKSAPLPILSSSVPYLEKIKKFITKSGLDSNIQDGFFLSCRQGVFSLLSGFGLAVYAETELTPQQGETFELLVEYGAFMQCLDDFLDVEKDIQTGIYTYMTIPGADINSISQFLSSWEHDLKIRLQISQVSVSSLLLSGMNFYHLFNSYFSPDDISRQSPYAIDGI